MGIEDTMRQFIEEELTGMYTVSMVMVESVDHQNRRCEVSMKYEEGVVMDSVPIATPFATNEFGAVFPVESGDEGFVLHNRQPIDDGMEEVGHVGQQSDRRFQVEDAILFPMVWNDEMTIPNHDPGELLIAHKAGQIVRLKPDGETVIETGVGEQGVKFTPDGAFKLLDEDGAGIVSDGNGNFTWYASDVNYTDSRTNL